MVNTNEKTAAATVLMSIFFALKFLVVIAFNFLLFILCYFLSLLSFDIAKIRRFSAVLQILVHHSSEFVWTDSPFMDK